MDFGFKMMFGFIFTSGQLMVRGSGGWGVALRLVASAGDGAYFMTPNTGLLRQMLGPISSYLGQQRECARGGKRRRKGALAVGWRESVLRFGVRRAVELRLAGNDAAAEPHRESLVPALE